MTVDLLFFAISRIFILVIVLERSLETIRMTKLAYPKILVVEMPPLPKGRRFLLTLRIMLRSHQSFIE